MTIERKSDAKDMRKRRKDARPARSLQAGLAEFAEKGLRRPGLRMWQNGRGSKGTIYRYFDDKEALFLASMESLATPAFTDLEGFWIRRICQPVTLFKALIIKSACAVVRG